MSNVIPMYQSNLIERIESQQQLLAEIQKFFGGNLYRFECPDGYDPDDSPIRAAYEITTALLFQCIEADIGELQESIPVADVVASIVPAGERN